MRTTQRPLYALVLAVLVVGLVVGVAFTGLSVNTVVAGVTILACLVMLLLMVMGRRDAAARADERDRL